MAEGSFEGKDARHPDIRRMFTREYLLGSDWYRARLHIKQSRDSKLWRRHVSYLDAFLTSPGNAEEAERLGVAKRRELAAGELARVSAPAYVESLIGTLGADAIGSCPDKNG